MKTNLRSAYVITGIENLEEATRVADLLETHGWSITFRWMARGRVMVDTHRSERQRLILEELQGVRSASVVVALLPGGRGMHVELGAALALGKPVVIVGSPEQGLLDGRPCIAYDHPDAVSVLPGDDVTLVNAVESAFAWRAF